MIPHPISGVRATRSVHRSDRCTRQQRR
jgi:hypothetical protein